MSYGAHHRETATALAWLLNHRTRRTGMALRLGPEGKVLGLEEVDVLGQVIGHQNVPHLIFHLQRCTRLVRNGLSTDQIGTARPLIDTT